MITGFSIVLSVLDECPRILLVISMTTVWSGVKVDLLSVRLSASQSVSLRDFLLASACPTE